MPKLVATIQYVSDANHLPKASQFRKWAKAALRVDTEVTIRIVDEIEGRTLNLAYRGKDYATNVLTFALIETPHLVGDIVICAPIIEREAADQAKQLTAHYAHLTVHSMLHLHGYDHETEAQAELMEAMEIQILAKLGYANPYLIIGDAKSK